MKNMTVKELILELENLFPLAYQEHYDNSGCQIIFPQDEIKSVLLTLDVNEAVVDEAISKNCNLIISHHPIFFKPFNNIQLGQPNSNVIIKAIKNNISIYSIHTNFDTSFEGTNKILSELLQLQNISILLPAENKLKKLVTFIPHSHVEQVRFALFNAGAGHIGNYDSCSYNIEGYGTFRGNEDTNPFVGKKGVIHQEPEVRVETIFPAYKENQIIKALLKAHPYEEVAYDIYPLSNIYQQVGLGMIGHLSEPISKEAFLWYVKDKIKAKVIKYNNSTKNIIQKVAVCSGSGASLINKAIQQQADAYITSDLTYHFFNDNSTNILLIDAGHYETEIHFVKKLFDIITKKNTNFAVHLSEYNINPVNYY